ncbi:hypothetical protein [Exiguobacterium sp. ZWU0009]|uniref:hypothetical protein n=1 Tax=Exiguobacterium sp. ZWU0009 TaxID=1224749 RepID=UPI000645FAF0|nr:hypothetical protein [Exiguobacterium sp. ZWU0009]
MTFDIELFEQIAQDIVKRTEEKTLGFHERVEQIEELCEMLYELDFRQRNSSKVKTILGLLSDSLLHETLKDPTPYKSKNTEYPIHSDRQLRMRTFKNTGIDNTLLTYDSKGKNRALPLRRLRTFYEIDIIEAGTIARNQERKDKYDAFVAGKEVPLLLKIDIKKECSDAETHTYNLSSSQ